MSENVSRSVAEIKAEQAAIEARLRSEKQRLDQELVLAEIDELERRCFDGFNDVEHAAAVAEYERALARAESSFLKAKRKALRSFAETLNLSAEADEPTE